MSKLGVIEAADELGVSPRRVRQMLADGIVSGQRVGRAWVIDRSALDELRDRRPEVGRPWRAASAWVLLALANGEDIEVSAVERSRARRRLESGLARLVGRLGARARRRRFYAHPSVIDRLASSSDVVRSGVSAADEHELDLVAGDLFEGYVRESAICGLVERFALDEDAERSNVLFRVVDDDIWPFRADEVVASTPVVAVDLLEAGDDRSRRAGAALLEQL